MRNETYTWKSFDGHDLFAQSWTPRNQAKAVINFVHGIGEHSSRYRDWMPFFVEAGFAVFAIEYRGHGRSFGKRGYIKNYEDLMKDIDVLFQESEKVLPHLPRFLYGHSLGGNLVINYAIDRKPNIKALVATSPWLQLSQEPPAWQLAMAQIIYKIAPGFIIKSNLKTEDISKNKTIVEAYKNDKMVHSKIALELFFSATQKGLWAIDHAEKITVPILLSHGSDDKITDPKGSQAFYNNNPKHTTLKIWDGMLHELHNEPIREQHAQYIIDWLNPFLK